MDEANANLVLPEAYTFIPIRALRNAVRKKMAQYLDLEGTLVVCDGIDVENNYNGLAELAGFSYLEIRNISRQRCPTMELLEQWTVKDGVVNATIGTIWNFLYMMERYDILEDCRANILNDCRIYEDQVEMEREAMHYNIEQDPEVSCSDMKVDETKFATVDDVKNNTKTMYDAFVCFTSESDADTKFVKEMIRELEVERKLKLFVPGRDDLPGPAKYVISAYLIEERCKRVIIIMSRAFLQSQECDFQVKFAFALSPGARSKKLIPVIREKQAVMPRILRFLAVCDFTKSEMKDWVWDRLFSAISAPIGPATYFEPEDPYNPFADAKKPNLHEIMFPTGKKHFEQGDNGAGASPGLPEAPADATPKKSKSIDPGSASSQGSRIVRGPKPAPSAVSSRDYPSLPSNNPPRSQQLQNITSLPCERGSMLGARGIPTESSELPDKSIHNKDNSRRTDTGRSSMRSTTAKPGDSGTISSTVHYV